MATNEYPPKISLDKSSLIKPNKNSGIAIKNFLIVNFFFISKNLFLA